MDKKLADKTIYLRLLITHLQEIKTVNQWAELCFEPIYTFRRRIQQNHKTTPIKILVGARLKAILRLMDKKPALSMYCIAREVGLRDEKDLNRFVKYHIGRPPTRLRKELSEIR